MADSDLKTAGTVTVDSDSGNTWSSTGNTASSDNARTVCALTTITSSKTLKLTNFGFTIPSGATDIGVELSVERNSRNANQIKDNNIQLIISGTASGTNKAVTLLFWGTTDATITYGGSSDSWGNTLTDTIINASNFGVAIKVDSLVALAAGSASIDYVTLKVYYTTGGGYTPVQKSVACTFAVYKSVLKNQSANFSIYKSVTKQQGASFSIYKSVLKQQSGSFAIYEAVLKSQSANFSVYQSIQKSQNSSFSIYESVQKQQSASFQIYKSVIKNQSCVFQIYKSVLRQVSCNFSIYNMVNKSQSASLQIYKSVSKSQSASFAIYQSVLKNQSVSFQLFQSVTKQMTCSFSVGDVVIDVPVKKLFEVQERLKLLNVTKKQKSFDISLKSRYFKVSVKKV